MTDEQTPSSPPPLDPERFGFAWDIAMALRTESLYRGRGQRLDHDDKIALARRILAHLKTSRVVLTRLPPLDGHGRRRD